MDREDALMWLQDRYPSISFAHELILHQIEMDMASNGATRITDEQIEQLEKDNLQEVNDEPERTTEDSKHVSDKTTNDGHVARTDADQL